jgi:hypothetical protein
MVIAGSSVRLTLAVNEPIVDQSSMYIKYTKPAGTTGQWAATLEDSVTGRIYYDIQPSEIGETGVWSVWAVITFNDGSVWKTPAKQFTVYSEGTVQK